MTKIQLTIKTTYLPTWGLWEGVREIIQNGKDAEVEHDSPLIVDWYNNTLRVENEGVVLPLKALLLGHTTKLHNDATIGKFGEGLKLGILALVRANHNVRIRNGSEVWVPSIEYNETFQEYVLCFTIEKGRQEKDRVRIEISGVTKENWLQFKSQFLFLKNPKNKVQTYEGDLLLDPELATKIFVKGIYVQSDPNLKYGYNLKHASLDRDRKMVESGDLRYTTKGILLAASASTQLPLMRLLEEGHYTEVQSISAYDHISSDVLDKIHKEFIHLHGSNATPVSNLAESQDIEHLGKKGVIVSKPLAAILTKVVGSIDTVKEELKKEVVKKYSWHELNEKEKENTKKVIEYVNPVRHLSLEHIEIVDFRSDIMEGQFKDNKILVAKKHILNFYKTLQIVIHEVAHRLDTDGTKSHVSEIEEIWMNVMRKSALQNNYLHK